MADTTEMWRPVVGYEELYDVSDLGHVRSRSRTTPHGHWRRGKLMKLTSFGSGYLRVGLCRDNKQTKLFVHRLVLDAFRGPCPDGMACRHLNGDPGDNRLNNLCWGTQVENMADRDRHGNTVRGDRHWKNRAAFASR